VTKTYPIRARIFHAVCREPEPDDMVEDFYAGDWWDEHIEADLRFFERLPQWLQFEGSSVLDYGCGGGHTCVLLAQRGARRVLGVDIDEVADFAERQLRERYPELADRVEVRDISSPEDIGDEQFDFVLSKNTFEHVEDPDRYVADMASHLGPGGLLVIGFGGLWKSPYGGHLQHMTKLPWMHLVIPEEVVLRERRRYRPDENPTRYEEITGGLNRMTLDKFTKTMARSGLERQYLEINRNDRPLAKALNMLSRVPGLTEYLTFSVHSVWRKPENAALTGDDLPTTGRASAV
jgi:SAM-dependent methyltransferase